MARPGGLGRGLGALIPTDGPVEAGTYREIRLDSVDVNQYQPRKHFDDEALDTLTASVREFGVLQPVVVRELDGGRYELIAGERRWRASRAAGLATIPAVVRNIDDEASLVQAVVENIHREDLNPLEEAAAYQQLLEDFAVTHDELGQRLGRSRAAISNAIRLLQLPVSIQVPLVDGEITAGHARALLGCDDPKLQQALLTKLLREGLSVRAVEQLVREANEPADEPADDRPDPGSTKPAALLEVEERLSEHLSTRVTVQVGAKRSRLHIDFADEQDLERIFELIGPSITD